MDKKIAILHSFGSGGAESVCVWTISALIKEVDIDLITMKRNISIKKINYFYGTDFKYNDFNIIQLNYLGKGSVLDSNRLQRYFKQNKSKYDFVISTKNEMDFGVRGIQYLHNPDIVKAIRHPPNFFKKIYYKFCLGLSGYNEERMKKNLTITNSYWTANEIKKAYGINAKVVYPPVEVDFPKVEWEQKKDGFICIGRIWTKKNLEGIIEILKEVRKDFPAISFDIIGRLQDKNYFNKISKIVKKNSDWVFMHIDLPYQEIKNYIVNYKYGIHGMKNEPFGIAIAEMVKAGCIVFVLNGGGQTEIVNNKQLIYFNQEDAVKKIKQVLENDLLQKKLLQDLKLNAKKFSKESFMREIRKVYRDFARSQP